MRLQNETLIRENQSLELQIQELRQQLAWPPAPVAGACSEEKLTERESEASGEGRSEPSPDGREASVEAATETGASDACADDGERSSSLESAVPASGAESSSAS